jgi:hypothetical protein
MDTTTKYDMLTVVGIDGAAALFNGVDDRFLPIRFDSVERALDFVASLDEDPRRMATTSLMGAWRAYRKKLIYGKPGAPVEAVEAE